MGSTESIMLLAAAILALALTSASAKCRNGAHEIKGRCLKFYDDKVNFAGAKARCKQYRAELFLVRKDHEDEDADLLWELNEVSQSWKTFLNNGGGLVWDMADCMVFDTTKLSDDMTEPDAAISKADCETTMAAYTCVAKPLSRG